MSAPHLILAGCELGHCGGSLFFRFSEFAT